MPSNKASDCLNPRNIRLVTHIKIYFYFHWSINSFWVSICSPVVTPLLWFGQLYLLLYCFLPLFSIFILFAKVVLLAFKPLLHNPFLWKERKINSIIAMIVLLVIASLVAPNLLLYHSTLRLFQGSIHLDKRVYRPFSLLHDVFR